MIGIYKITNLVNGKCYIGQSVHIERRFQEHCFPSNISTIAKAIKKYGKNNFNFEIIEECKRDELNEKEKYWINFYNSIVPNGYNVSEDTETTHTCYTFYSKEIILNIIDDLKYSNLSMKEIGKKYNINVSSVSRINSGKTHRQENLFYPIRKTEKIKHPERYCVDCGKKIYYLSTRCNDCANKHKRIPLEEMPVTREELKFLIRNKSFLQIGKQFNVSDSAIRKWCLKFNLPNKKKDIKLYSDKDWEKI